MRRLRGRRWSLWSSLAGFELQGRRYMSCPWTSWVTTPVKWMSMRSHWKRTTGRALCSLARWQTLPNKPFPT
eukprot:545259-Karenia_brevis.AAC.1